MFQHVFDTQVRGAELSSDHSGDEMSQVAVRLLDRPGKPQRVVQVNWEHVGEAPVQESFIPNS